VSFTEGAAGNPRKNDLGKENGGRKSSKGVFAKWFLCLPLGKPEGGGGDHQKNRKTQSIKNNLAVWIKRLRSSGEKESILEISLHPLFEILSGLWGEDPWRGGGS